LRSSDRVATLADLQQILDATPVDAQWADDLARQRDEDAAAARDPWSR
jgi:hypothetical protein